MFPLLRLDTSFTPEQERDVLLDIYASTNGPQWCQRSGWNSTTNGTSHCSWHGITCHSNTSYIKTIVLAYNNLDGSLPSNIWKIRNLLSMCTPGNPSLRGGIGGFLFGNMSNLLTVVFNAASIDGEIPKEIAKMRRLQNFLACIMNGDGLTRTSTRRHRKYDRTASIVPWRKQLNWTNTEEYIYIEQALVS